MMILSDKLSNTEYHAKKDYISSSDVKMVHNTSLAHWKAKVYKTSTNFDLGTAVHANCLEAEKNLVMRGPETRRGKAWSELYEHAQAEEKTLLTSSDYDIARAVSDSVLFHPVGQRMAGDTTINEASFFADDPSGLKIKCRPDSYWEENGVVYDIKTCQSSAPSAVSRDVLTYSYHAQAAFYLKTLTQAGFHAKRFAFVFVEKTAPYAVNVSELAPEFLEYGFKIVDETLAKIKEANDVGEFPTGFSDEVNTIDLPRWLQPAAEFNS
jgi:hypothetical protein